MSLLSITTLQADLVWEDKAANLRLFESKLEQLPKDAEIVVLPEMFTTGFSMNAAALAEDMEGETIDWMRDMAANYRIVLTGSMIAKVGDAYFNRLIWMLPNGQFGYYDKRHLFSLGNEHEHYQPGIKRLIASVKGWKINVQICYDLRFPVWARQQIDRTTEMLQPEYDVLIYVANWPEKRSHAWKTLLCARAIENQCYVVGVNRVGKDGNNVYHSGNSLVIDPLGEVLYHVADEEDMATLQLQKEHLDEVRARLPFWKDGDGFLIQ
jgi:predicted amidohydrolase